MTSQHWTITKQEYFEAPGLGALVFHNAYPEGKQGGLELIQHGERIATNGNVFVNVGPLFSGNRPKARERQVNAERAEISVPVEYPEGTIAYTIRVRAEDSALYVAVDLAAPLPDEWMGRASFNLELYPGAYFGKTFHLGDTSGVFPRQANGPVAPNADGQLWPLPLATGQRLVVAPEDPQRMLSIAALTGELALLDIRSLMPHNWFAVHALIPPGVTHNAICWKIDMHSISGWQRDPMIGFSQVGYHPDQEKRAIIELPAGSVLTHDAALARIQPEGGTTEVLKARPEPWGKFLRYDYAVFDFTAIQEPGMYVIRYANQTTEPFKISRDVYRKDVWQPTLETFFPVQMCHTEVRDGARVWHGACHLDDALQAPSPHEHFDGYRQGADTETAYQPFEHVPGLDRGGWHDAGDYDLAAGSQAETTFILALARETFGVDTDQTTVKPDERLVLLHTPDGTPDILEQVRHGVENLLSGYRIAGHSFLGIIESTMLQYGHLGDAATITDNRVYDASLRPDEVVNGRSGKRDDRWVFTTRSTTLEYQVATALAAASRVLRGYEDALADECLQTALNIWEHEHAHEPAEHKSAYVPWNEDAQEILAATELLITTDDARYRQRLLELWPNIEKHGKQVGWGVARALPHIQDAAFAAQFRQLAAISAEELRQHLAENPFGVPFDPHIWGIGWQIQAYAVAQYYLVQAFPDLFNREHVLRVVNFVLGCHPGSNVSFVSGVGARSLTTAFGVNRADWSYIPGGNVSGVALIRPDFPELKEPFPFLWQQTEYVMPGAATYIFCVLAADRLLNG